MFAFQVFIIIGVAVSRLDLTAAQHQYRYMYDLTTVNDKSKIKLLCQELVAEARYKIHQTEALRDKMSTKPAFQVGMIIGQIREKYKTMLEVYRQMMTKHRKKSLIMPYREHPRSIHYFWRMEYIFALEIDIDRLVHIAEQVPLHTISDIPDEFAKTDRPYGLRQGGRSQEFEELLARKEEEIKQGYRHDYLMEKLALAENNSAGL